MRLDFVLRPGPGPQKVPDHDFPVMPAPSVAPLISAFGFHGRARTGRIRRGEGAARRAAFDAGGHG
jgi:hypothetical protein